MVILYPYIVTYLLLNEYITEIRYYAIPYNKYDPLDWRFCAIKGKRNRLLPKFNIKPIKLQSQAEMT